MPNSSLIRNVYWSMLQVWGVRISTLLVFTLLARTLSPADIGVVGYVLGFLVVFQVFADLGLAEYLVYEHKADRSLQLAVWWLQIALAVLISLALTFIVYFGFIPLKDEINEVMLALIWTIPITTAARVPEALMRKDLKFREIAVRSFIAITAGGMVGVTLAYSGFGVWSLVAKQWIEVVVDLVMLFSLSRWRPGFEYAFSDSLHVLRHSWGIVWSRLLDVLMQKADVLIIGSFIGVAELGYYTVGQRMFQVLRDGFAGALASVLSPRYSKLRENEITLKAFFLSSIQGSNLIIAPIFVLAAFFAPEFITLLFGSKWESSAEVLYWMCLSGVLLGAGTLNGFLVLAMQKNMLFSTLMSVGFVVSMLLMLVAAPFGINALAATRLVRSLMMFPLGLYFVMRLIDIDFIEYVKSIEPSLVIVALISVIVLLANYWLDISGVLPAIFLFLAVIVLSLATIRVFYWGQIKSIRDYVLQNKVAPI